MPRHSHQKSGLRTARVLMAVLARAPSALQFRKTPFLFIATINLNLSHVFFREPHRDVMFRFTETGIISAKV